jgi:Uma2 family endonuclease
MDLQEVLAMGVPLQKLTLADFLAWENAQVEKHEFHRGEVFAMVGGRRSQGRVILNLARQLMNRMDGSPCQVFADSMKLQIADDTILYPDVFVTCDKADLATDQIFRAPTLVIEVLSPSTQAYDRSQKFALYRRIASLQEYVLVDPDTRRVESFRHNAAGEWVFHDMSADEAMLLPCIDARIALADVFDGVDPAE